MTMLGLCAETKHRERGKGLEECSPCVGKSRRTENIYSARRKRRRDFISGVNIIKRGKCRACGQVERVRQ